MKIKSSIIRDSIELCNAKGEVEKEIKFTVNITKIAKDVQEIRSAMAQTDKDDVERMGKLTVDLFALIFGEEATKELLEYYENDYTTMIIDVTPFMVNVVFPAVEETRENALKLVKGRKRG